MLFHMLQGQKIKSRMSLRDYYNKIHEEVNKKPSLDRSLRRYDPTYTLIGSRIYGDRVCRTTCSHRVVALADADACLGTARWSRLIRYTRSGRRRKSRVKKPLPLDM